MNKMNASEAAMMSGWRAGDGRGICVLAAVIAMLAGMPLFAQPAVENQRFRLAQGYEASGDFTNAARVYRELYNIDPRSQAYFDGVRRTYMQLRQYAELLPLVEARLEHDGKNIVLRIQYADLLSRTNRPAEALREWNAAIETRPDDPITYQLVAQSQVDDHQLALAAETYTTGRRRLNDGEIFNAELARIEAALGHYGEATREYLTMLDIDASRMGAVFGGLGVFTSNPDGADAAIATVSNRLAAKPEHVPYLELLEWLYTERGDEARAFDVAQRLDRARHGNGSDVYAYIDRAVREGKFEAATAAADYFQKQYPKDNSLYSSVMLASTKALDGAYHARAGEHTASDARALVERYRTIARDNPRSAAAGEALLHAAQLEADPLDDAPAAIALLTELRTDYPRFPDLAAGMLLEGDLHLRMGDRTAAAEAWRLGRLQAETQSDDASRGIGALCALRQAELLFFNGAFKDAATAFAALASDPTSDAANDALAYQFLLQENMEAAPEALRFYAAGLLAMRTHAWADARTQLDQAARGAPRDGGLIDAAAIATAEAEVMLDHAGDAIATLLAVVLARPDGALADRALHRAAELSETKLGDRPRAIELYNRLLAEYPMSTYAGDARLRIRALRGDG